MNRRHRPTWRRDTTMCTCWVGVGRCDGAFSEAADAVAASRVSAGRRGRVCPNSSPQGAEAGCAARRLRMRRRRATPSAHGHAEQLAGDGPHLAVTILER